MTLRKNPLGIQRKLMSFSATLTSMALVCGGSAFANDDKSDEYFTPESTSEISATDVPEGIVEFDAESLPTTSHAAEDAIDIVRVSEAFGHLVVSNLDNPGFKFDIDAIIKGMRDAQAGHSSPMTEEQYERAISSIQEKIFTEMASRNLEEANHFMENNAREDDVVVVEPGKLHYQISQTGNGKEILSDATPLINYTGRYLDGTVFGSSYETGSPVTLPLERTIAGFRMGLVGMKEGEKRTLYIHPDMGYGMSGHLPPNSLLVFEIELLEANRNIALTDENSQTASSDEIGSEMEETEAIR